MTYFWVKPKAMFKLKRTAIDISDILDAIIQSITGISTDITVQMSTMMTDTLKDWYWYNDNGTLVSFKNYATASDKVPFGQLTAMMNDAFPDPLKADEYKGLKLVYGADSKKLHILYHPVKLEKVKDLGRGIIQVKVTDTGKLYMLENNVLVLKTDPAELETYTRNYARNIHWENPRAAAMHKVPLLIDGTLPDLTDPDSIIYTWREIELLKNQNEVDGKIVPNIIFEYGASITKRFDHHIMEILIKPDRQDGPGNGVRGVYTNMHANVGSLCPPNCATIAISIA